MMLVLIAILFLVHLGLAIYAFVRATEDGWPWLFLGLFNLSFVALNVLNFIRYYNS